MPAPLIGAAIAGGAALFGAHEQASAAKKASQAQQDAAAKAQAFNQGVYNDTKANMAPYISGGTQAFQNLLAQHFGSPFEQQVAQQVQAGRNPYAFAPPASMPSPPRNIGYGFGPPQAQPMSVGSGQTPAAAANTGAMVTVRDDNGETRQVPAAQGDLYRQKGFQVMG